MLQSGKIQQKKYNKLQSYDNIVHIRNGELLSDKKEDY